MHQRFESRAVSSTEMVEVLGIEPRRISLVLQNQHATANIWIANTPHINGAARLLLPPGGDLLMDVRVPSDAVYAMTDVAGAELTIVAGFA